LALECKKWVVEIVTWVWWSFSIQFIRLVFVMPSVSVMVSLRQDGIVYHLSFKVRHIWLILWEFSIGSSIVLVNISMGWAQSRSDMEVTARCVKGWRSKSLLLCVKGVALFGGGNRSCQNIDSLWLNEISCVLSHHIWFDDSWVVSISGSLNLSVGGSDHLVLIGMGLLHLLLSNVLCLWHVRVACVVEQHRPRWDRHRFNCLLNAMVNSVRLICSVCALVIKCLFLLILLGLCHHSRQRREAQFVGDLGEVLRSLDLPVGHQTIALLVNSICYNASGFNQVLNIMMWLRFFLVNLLHKVVPMSHGPVARFDDLPALEKFEWLGFINVLYLILKLLVDVNVLWSFWFVCRLSITFIFVNIFQNCVIWWAPLWACIRI